jgi:hypothetical protein
LIEPVETIATKRRVKYPEDKTRLVNGLAEVRFGLTLHMTQKGVITLGVKYKNFRGVGTKSYSELVKVDPVKLEYVLDPSRSVCLSESERRRWIEFITRETLQAANLDLSRDFLSKVFEKCNTDQVEDLVHYQVFKLCFSKVFKYEIDNLGSFSTGTHDCIGRVTS